MDSIREQKDESSEIVISTLDELLEKIGQKPANFYRKIGEALTPQERMYIIQNLEHKYCYVCLNGSCRVSYYDKCLYDLGEQPSDFQCLGWMNHEIVGKSKVLQINDVMCLK